MGGRSEADGGGGPEEMVSGDPAELSDRPRDCDKQTSKPRDGGATGQKQPGCQIAYLEGATQESGPPGSIRAAFA